MLGLLCIRCYALGYVLGVRTKRRQPGIGLRLKTSHALCPTPYTYTLYTALRSYTLRPTPYWNWSAIENILHPMPCARHPTPYALRPTPYDLRPAINALRPTPYALRPTPYALPSTPYALRP